MKNLSYAMIFCIFCYLNIKNTNITREWWFCDDFSYAVGVIVGYDYIITYLQRNGYSGCF